MNATLSALAAVIGVSLLSGIGVLSLVLRESFLRRLVQFLVAMSVGALFGDAFIHLLPEAFSGASSPLLASTALSAGVLAFFLLEKVLRWRHSHGIHEESLESLAAHDHEKKRIGWLIFAGDGVHNFIDGVIIGSSFLVSQELGLATTLAIILHEIPQEMGDFGLLLHAGWTRTKAILFNFASALFAVFGTVFALSIGGGKVSTLALLNAFAAGGFIYIAGADLVPELHSSNPSIRGSVIQVLAVTLGFALMFGLTVLD